MGLEGGLVHVQHPKSMGTGKSARAFVLISEAKNLGVSQTHTEFIFPSKIRSQKAVFYFVGMPNNQARKEL